MSSSDKWTREELEALTPFDSATRQVDDGIVPMTRDEYDQWISSAVGTEKFSFGPESLVDSAFRMRGTRNVLLAESDYRMVADGPWDIEAWATYRQALRDLPADPAWPDVEFPEPPNP